VKTRLKPRFGKRGAAAIHRALLHHCFATLAANPMATTEFWVAPHRYHPFSHRLVARYRADLCVQQGGDLGSRMGHAFKRAFGRADYVVLVGGDAPMMTAAYVEQAFRALEEGADAVLGPAEDGGYMLIGLRRGASMPFSSMRWSNAQVLAETRRRLRMAGMQWIELETLWDVDRAADVKRMRSAGLVDHIAFSVKHTF